MTIRLTLLLGLPLIAGGAIAAGKDVSFARDVQPIFNAQCVMCHNSSDPHAGLALDPGLSRSQLVEVNSTEVPTMFRIQPDKPEESYLMRKLENTHLAVGGKGWWMPPPTHFQSAVTARDKAFVRKWIEQGAKDN